MATRSRPPGWAVLCTIVGSLLMVTSGSVVVAGEWLLDRYDLRQQELFEQDSQRYGEDLEGPLNILLAGLDTRPSRADEAGRADAIMIVHVPAGLDQAYLISLPRDLLVEIPPLPDSGYYGGTDRLNSAMFIGAQQRPGEEQPNLSRGFSHLADTVSQLTGIDYWDAGVVLDFEGFVEVVDAIGGVSVELTETIVSEHRQPDGTHRPLNPGGEGYHGPQMVYEAGTPPCHGPALAGGGFVCDLNGWQALDVARQRYSVSDGDHGRQHNQQRLMQAIMDRALDRDVVSSPLAMDRLMRAAGDSLLFDGRGHRAIDFAFALRGIRPDTLEMIVLPTAGVGTGAGYQGEQLEPTGSELFVALRDGRLESFLEANPELRR